MRFFHRLLARALVVALVALSSFAALAPHPAEAQLSLGSIVGSAAGSFASCKVGGLISEAINGLSDTATNLVSQTLGLGNFFGSGDSMVPTNPVPTETRECTLDGMAWRLANDLLDQITRDIVAWIETGFEGGPAFITNLNGFMTDIADVAAGEFLSKSGFNFVCSPFKIDVQIAFALSYGKTQGEEAQNYCSLSQIVDNTTGALDRFINGSFQDGGWPAWFQIVQQPENLPVEALMRIKRKFAITVKNKQNEELKYLEFGDGWFSLRDEKGSIITPGDFVQKKVDSWTNSYQNRLQVADDVNEIVQALVAYFVRDVLFNQEKGLLGGRSYLDRAGGINPGGLKSEIVARVDELILQAQAQGNAEALVGLQNLRAELSALNQSDPDYFAKLQVARTQLSVYESLLQENGARAAGGVGEAPPPPAPVPPAPDGSTGGNNAGGLGGTPGTPNFTYGTSVSAGSAADSGAPAAETLPGISGGSGNGGGFTLPNEPQPLQ